MLLPDDCLKVELTYVDIIQQGESIGDGDDGGENVYSRSTEPVLVSLSNLYSDNERISVDNSRPSSCSTYTILLTTSSTDYCPKEKGMRFWSKKTILL